MKIGIISDTHDDHKNVLKAIEVLNQNQVEYVLHAGDIVSPFTAKAFSDIKGAKFISVFGNNEGEKLFVKQTVESFGGEIYEYAYRGTLGSRKIFMTHVPTSIEEIAQSGKYDLVIYGHTHKRDIRTVGNTLVINPGEVTDWITGKPSIVILELDDMSHEVIML
ncbi:MAG: metallophosphoesterase [Phycisphaerae bacterium]